MLAEGEDVGGLGEGDDSEEGFEVEAVGDFDDGPDVGGEAEGEGAVGGDEDGEGVGLLFPEFVVFDEVSDGLFDGVAEFPGGVVADELVEGGFGEDAEFDAVLLGVVGEWCGAEVDRDTGGGADGEEGFDFGAGGEVDVQQGVVLEGDWEQWGCVGRDRAG